MAPINFSVTATAMNQIQKVIQGRIPVPFGVRLFVYQDAGKIAHGMTLADTVDPSDKALQMGDVTFLFDENSAIFLNNMILDYVEMEGAQGFVFQDSCMGKSCLTCRGACQKASSIQ